MQEIYSNIVFKFRWKLYNFKAVSKSSYVNKEPLVDSVISSCYSKRECVIQWNVLVAILSSVEQK